MQFLKEKYEAEYVLNSQQPDFLEELKGLSKKLGANVCLEAVAGEHWADSRSNM